MVVSTTYQEALAPAHSENEAHMLRILLTTTAQMLKINSRPFGFYAPPYCSFNRHDRLSYKIRYLSRVSTRRKSLPRIFYKTVIRERQNFYLITMKWLVVDLLTIYFITVRFSIIIIRQLSVRATIVHNNALLDR